MTSQTRERLLYKGQDYGMATEPLEQYLKTRNDIHINNGIIDTGCRRGYVGSWEIRDNRLFLIGLKGIGEEIDERVTFPEKRKIDLNYIFPNEERVFASWFSGHIRLEIGELLKYVHLGYESIHEKDLVLTLENGVIVHEEEFDNSNVENVQTAHSRLQTMDEQLTEIEKMENRLMRLIEVIRKPYEGTEEALSNFAPVVMGMLAKKGIIIEEVKTLCNITEKDKEYKEYMMKYFQDLIDINFTEEQIALIEDRFRKTETQEILTQAQKMYPYLTEELSGYTEKELMVLVEKSKSEKDWVSIREQRDERGWIVDRCDFVVDYRHATTEQIIKDQKDKIAKNRAVALHLYLQKQLKTPSEEELTGLERIMLKEGSPSGQEMDRIMQMGLQEALIMRWLEKTSGQTIQDTAESPDC